MELVTTTDNHGDQLQSPTSPASAETVKESLTVKMTDVANNNEDPSLAWKLQNVSFRNGPDQILPSTATRTYEANGAVRIPGLNLEPAGQKPRMNGHHNVATSTSGGVDIGRRPPISVPSLLTQAAERAPPNHVALAIKREGRWQKWTYKQYLSDVRTVAKGFIALGLERFHSVCILGINTPEWFQADLGAIFAGGFAVGIYATNTPEACAFCAKDSKANILVVEDKIQLDKILQVRHQLPDLKAIVQYIGEPTPLSEDEKGNLKVMSWSQLLLLGQSQPDTELQERLSLIAINQCCTIVYTSGTAGSPKGVLLTHDNMIWTSYSLCQRCHLRQFEEEWISFLPLSHVAAQTADIYIPLHYCSTIYFGDKNALKGSLVETMKEVQPTKIFAVPRVWEKMYEKMQEVGRANKGLRKVIAKWAKGQGLEHNLKRLEAGNGGANLPVPLGFQIANNLILSKVRAALGLTRCTVHFSGAAPLSVEIVKYFMSLNIIITEVYGMTECSGPHTVAVETLNRLASCGKPIDGSWTKIVPLNDESGAEHDGGGDGEVLIGGRHVAMGYLHQPEKTVAAIDPDGWLHSEDVGHLDKDGFLFITGRLKELLITAGGENVAPVPIEEKIKHFLPFLVSHALLLGDRLKFLSVLLTVRVDINMDTQEPQDTLQPITVEWLKEHGDCKGMTTIQNFLDELYVKKNQKLRQAIQMGIDQVNVKATSNAQKIQKWHFLPQDFSIPGGELGPTLKLKRQVVYTKYQNVIDQLYR